MRQTDALERFAPWAAGALLVVMGVLAGGAALRESVTYDETTHIGAGLSHWQKLDLRLCEEHPPLGKLIAAFPLFLSGARADYSHVSWTSSERFFPAYTGQLFFGELVLKHWNNAQRTLALARLPMLLLMLLLGGLVYLYAQEIGGTWGGLLSTAAYATTPLFLAHGPLVLTDVPLAAFSVLALFCGASLWRKPSRRGTVIFALSMAGALLTKFSAPVLAVALLASGLTLWAWPRTSGLRFGARRFRYVLAGIGCAGVTAYVFYLVFSWNQPTNVLCDLHGGLGVMFLRRLLMPPWLYLRGLFLVTLSSSRETFIVGHSYPHGVWFYFPVLLCLKSLLGFLVLLLLAGMIAVQRAWRKPCKPVIPECAIAHWRMLWITLVVFSAVCMASSLNIGFRHFSVPLVLLILMLAPLPRMVGQLRESSPGLAGVLILVMFGCVAQCLFAAVAAYPFYLPYANALVSGRPSYERFNDSNLDWDQALPEVERFVERNGIQNIRLDHYGYSNAAATIPGANIWDCEIPTAADGGHWAAVSANFIISRRNCGWLLQYHHETLAGGSMYVFRLPEVIPAPGSAGGPPPETMRSGFLRTAQGGDAHQLFVDFVRDPSIVSRSGEDADQILRRWSASFLENRPWLQRKVIRWAQDGAKR